MLLGMALLMAGNPAEAEVPPEVKNLFKGTCKKCHDWDGKAQTAMGKKFKIVDFTTAEYQQNTTDERIKKTILEGYQDPEDPKRKMKAFKGQVSEEQAAELVKVIRAFGETPGPFADEVK